MRTKRRPAEHITPAQISWRNNLLTKLAIEPPCWVSRIRKSILMTIWRKGGGGLECHQNGCYWVSSNTWFRHMFQDITGRLPTQVQTQDGAADQTHKHQTYLLWVLSKTFCCSCVLLPDRRKAYQNPRTFTSVSRRQSFHCQNEDRAGAVFGCMQDLFLSCTYLKYIHDMIWLFG